MITLDSIELPNETLWIDEFDWNQRKSNMAYSLQGKLLVRTSLATAGRPITLGGPNAMISRNTLETLYSMAESQSEYNLSLHDGRTFTVIFRQWENPIVVKALVGDNYSNPQSSNYYILEELRLAEVG